jgi:gas vesicle protein
MNDNSKFIGSLLLAAIAGAAVTLYLSSESGSKLRQSLVAKAGDLFEELKDRAEYGKETAITVADKLGNSAENISKKVVDAATSTKKSASELYV